MEGIKITSKNVMKLLSAYFKQMQNSSYNLALYRQLVPVYNFPNILLHKKEDIPKGFEKFFKQDDKNKDSDEKSEKKQDSNKDDDNKNANKKENEDKEKSKDKKQEAKKSPFDDTEFDFNNYQRIRFPWGLFFAGTGIYLIWEAYKEQKERKPLTKQELIDLIKNKSLAKLEAFRNRDRTEIFAVNREGITLGMYATLDRPSFEKELEKIQVDAGVQQQDLLRLSEKRRKSLDFFSLALFATIGYLLANILFRGRGGSRFGGSSSNFFKNTSDSNPTKGDKGESGRPRDMLSNFFGFGTSKAIEYGEMNKVEVNFKDVAGMEGPKEEIQEFVEFLRNPEKFRKLGAKIPKGALLAGPPGTGKTLLAKACAGEANVPFFATSGSEFVEMFVGVGAARVRDLFRKAKNKSPSIIFIDEIDAIGKHRSKIGYNDERESTLNQIFVELDGFGTDTNVVVFAATNRKDALDKALIRPGRFDRIIEVNLPELKERESIFGVHLRKLVVSNKHTKPEIAQKLAALTMGMSGADIASVCNEAAILAARRDKKAIDLDDFYEAYDRVLTGLKRKLPMTEHNKKVTAFHEAGHAIVGWFLKNSQPVLKISVVPRSKGSLGHTIMMPDEVELYRKEQIEDMICTMYGGRAAEELYLGSITTGARDDFSKATQLAKHYVGVFGMSKEFGHISGIDYANSFGMERKTLYSGHTAKKFDKLVNDLCNEQYERAKKLLKEKEKEIRKLAEMLLKKETVELDDLTELLGPMPHKSIEGMSTYIADLKKKKEEQKKEDKKEAKTEESKKGN